MAGTSAAICSRMIQAWKWTRLPEPPVSVPARYAGEHATDAAQQRAVAGAACSEVSRTARLVFVCVIALVLDGKLVKTFRGAVEGRIIDEARGSGGFGYDPLFIVQTSAPPSAKPPWSKKMRVSHRGRALAACSLTCEIPFHLRKPTLVFCVPDLPGADHCRRFPWP